MNLIDEYTIKRVPKEFPPAGFNIWHSSCIGNKEVMNIDFINPIRINGKSYEYKNKQLGDKTINDFSLIPFHYNNISYLESVLIIRRNMI